ncbi:MAG: type II secretion system protein GspM, partial [Myxococcota bacterium]
MSGWLSRIWNAFSTLEPRERLLVGIAGSVAVVMLIVFGIAMPLMAATRNSERRAEAAETEVVAVRALRDQFDAVNGRLGSVEERIHAGPQGEIFTTLEQ